MITHGALKRLASHEFRITNPRADTSHPLDCGFPLIVADHSVYPTEYAWRLPSVGDGSIDLGLGRVMALGYLVYEAVADDDQYQLILGDILGAMQIGEIGELQREGFATVLFQFIECALFRPEHLPTLRDRLKLLTDTELTARYRAVLRGEAPPDIFADLAPVTP